MRIWNPNNLTCIPLVGIKHLAKTGTNFRLEWFDESAIKDTYSATRKSLITSRNGASTFTTILSHFILAHMNIFEDKFCTMVGVQSTDLNEWLCLILWKTCNPSYAARRFRSPFTSSCFVMKEVSLRLAFFAATASLYFFLAVCCVISARPSCSTENSGLQAVH
jgi:hypothetical protein